jgi:hypothetical protein
VVNSRKEKEEGQTMNLVERIKGILLKPKEERKTISGETTTIAKLYKTYIVILEPSLGRQRVPINRDLHLALERYGLTVQLMEAMGPRQRDWER